MQLILFASDPTSVLDAEGIPSPRQLDVGLQRGAEDPRPSVITRLLRQERAIPNEQAIAVEPEVLALHDGPPGVGPVVLRGHL